MIHLHGYCVRSAGDAPPAEGLSGVLGAGVSVVEHAGLGLWYSALERRPAVEVELLKQHDRVLREALRSATPLPMRYGTGFTDLDAARSMLGEHAEAFAAKLEELDDRVEMGIQLSWSAATRSDHQPARDPAPTEAAHGPEADAGHGGGTEASVGRGRAYLEARKRELLAAERTRAEAEEAIERVVAKLADLELPTHRKVLPGGGALGMVAHLVQRERLRAYRTRVQEIQKELPDLRLAPSGPWAPYSFV